MSRKITRKWKGAVVQKRHITRPERAIKIDVPELYASAGKVTQVYAAAPIAIPAVAALEPESVVEESAVAPAEVPLREEAGRAARQVLRRNLAEASETELSARLLDDVAQNSSDVSALCDTYHLRREELGRLTGFSLRALAEWASGKLPSQPAQRRLHEVKRLLDALAGIVEPQRIPEWLRRPNPTFDRLTPLQVIELGEIDRLWAMVHDLGSGQPT